MLLKSLSNLCTTCTNIINEKPKLEEVKVPAADPIPTKDSITIEIHKNNREYVHGKAFKSGEPRWIVVHYTACVNVSAKSMCKSMVNNNEASTHFYVDEDEIWEAVPLKYTAWHVGNGACKQPDSEHKKTLKELANYKTKDWRYDLAAKNHLKWQSKGDDFLGNSQSIGVDICVKKLSNKTKKATDLDWYFEDDAVENTAKLVAYLAQKYNISINHIITHCMATGKLCPRPMVSTQNDSRGDTAWEEFKDQVKSYMDMNIEAARV